MKKLLIILVMVAFAAAAVSAQEIAVIVKTGNSSFWQNVQTGCFDAQKALKAKIAEAFRHVPWTAIREQRRGGDQHRRKRDRPRCQGHRARAV